METCIYCNRVIRESRSKHRRDCLTLSGTIKGIFAEGVVSELSLKVEEEKLRLWGRQGATSGPTQPNTSLSVTAHVFEKDSKMISRACTQWLSGHVQGKERGNEINWDGF